MFLLNLLTLIVKNFPSIRDLLGLKVVVI